MPAFQFKRATDYIFSKKFIKYFFSSHFWGPASNFGIPIAALADLKKDPEVISGPMTSSLIVYSMVFMRYATQVTPKNPLLFICHFTNEIAQIGQGCRYLNYHYNFFNKDGKKEIPSISGKK